MLAMLAMAMVGEMRLLMAVWVMAMVWEMAMETVGNGVPSVETKTITEA